MLSLPLVEQLAFAGPDFLKQGDQHNRGVAYAPLNASSVKTFEEIPMAKTASKSTRHADPDAALIAMIQRHTELWKEWDRIVLVDKNEDDPRINVLSTECCELERRIVATPAHTQRGLSGKRRIAKRAVLETWDDLGIIDTILQLDAERVAAS